MAGLDRSAALRRLGITEWLPRQDDAAIVSAVSAAEPVAAVVSSVAQTEVTAATPAAPIAHDQVPMSAAATAASSSALPTSTPSKPSTPAAAVSAIAAPTASTSAAAPAVNTISVAPSSLRGRLLSAPAQAPLLVLAMAEKSPRDSLLNVESSAGALLQAMLSELAVPTAVALLGVGGGESIAVPATVLVLGERSARLLLGNDVAMPLRGRVHFFGSARVVVTYHPDELRQNGSLKRLAWDDLRLLSGLLATANAAGTATATTGVGNGSR